MDTNGARRGISRALLVAFTALFVAAASGCSFGAPTPRVSATRAPSATSTRLPLAFEPNVGQAPADVRYVARSERYRVWLTPTGARFAAADSPGREIRLSLIGGAAAPSLAPVAELPGKAHYFIGKSEADWRTNVATYRRVVYRGAELAGRPPEAIARLGIGLVPQGRRIFPNLSVLENLQIARRGDRGFTLERVFATFPPLHALRGARGATLSGGELQLLAIARALMGNVDALLLDEPFEGLAPAIVEVVWNVLREIKGETTILLVEQNADLALALSDRAYVIGNGSIVWSGAARALHADEELRLRLLGV